MQSTWLVFLTCEEFDRHYCCSCSLFDVISTDTVLLLSSLPILFDYDSCLRDNITVKVKKP